jgi:hypothetical protein
MANLHQYVVINTGRLLKSWINIDAELRYNNIDFMSFTVEPVESSQKSFAAEGFCKT